MSAPGSDTDAAPQCGTVNVLFQKGRMSNAHPILRAPLILAAFAWGTYLFAMERTSNFGPRYSTYLGPMAILFVYIGVPAAFAFVGMSWRRGILGVLAIFVGFLAVSETFGRAQEMQVMRTYGTVPERNLTIYRWWPFRHHEIYFSKNHGWSGCD